MDLIQGLFLYIVPKDEVRNTFPGDARGSAVETLAAQLYFRSLGQLYQGTHP